MNIDYSKLEKAILLVHEGASKRIDLENIKIYAMGENIIRIDIKK